MLTGFSSVVWYFVLVGHTRTHHFFTYRVYCVSILAFIAIALLSIHGSEKEWKAAKGRLNAFVAVIVAGVASLLLMSLARETISVLNGEYEYRRVALELGDGFEVCFSPSFNQITNFMLGLESESKNGYCEIKLWDAEDAIYQENLYLEDFDQGHLQWMNVRWKFNSKKKYRLTLEVADVLEPVYVWVSEDGAMPLTEYGELWINGRYEEGQLLTGITYWTLPPSRKTQIFLAMTWMGILLSVAYALWPSRSFRQKSLS